MVDCFFGFERDQEGSLNQDDELGLADDPLKNELERVSEFEVDEDPNGHHEDDFDSCAKSWFDEKATRTKPKIAILCAFMASLPFNSRLKYQGLALGSANGRDFLKLQDVTVNAVSPTIFAFAFFGVARPLFLRERLLEMFAFHPRRVTERPTG